MFSIADEVNSNRLGLVSMFGLGGDVSVLGAIRIVITLTLKLTLKPDPYSQ